MIAFLRFVAALFAAAFLSSAALAQVEQVYTVNDLAVDETAGSATEAQQKAWAKARAMAAQRLVNRLTLPEDRQGANPPLDYAALSRLVISTDTGSDEKRTTTRYIATLGMRFKPSEVRQFLESRNVAYVEAQAGRALVVAAAAGLDPVAWQKAWAEKTDPNSLTPYVVSDEAWPRHPAWSDVEAEARSKGAARAVVAEAYNQGGSMYVRLTELRAGESPVALAVAGPFSTFEAAQPGVVDAMETAWKKASVVRTSGSTGMELVASFSTASDWVRIRKGLEQSRMIRDMQVVALSTQGADISFVYSGRPDQLAADLRSRGLDLQGADGGWVVRTSGGR